MLRIGHVICLCNVFVYSLIDISPELVQDDEFFTAASDMALLLKVEHRLGHGLRSYIEKENQKIEKLEREIEKIEQYHKEQVKTDHYPLMLWISNPSNAYGMIKRFIHFWPVFRKHAIDGKTQSLRKELIKDLESLEGAYPSEADLRGALAAIVRIQNTYNITAKELMQLGRRKHNLSALELFQMGYLWSELEEYYYAREWFLESLKRYPKKLKIVGFLEKASLYEYLAWSEYKLFNINEAIKYTRYMLKIKPGYDIAITNLKLFQKYKDMLKKEDSLDMSKTKVKSLINGTTGNYTWEVGKHNLLCSGRLPMETHISSKLYCQYQSSKAEFILKPLKVEKMYNDPDVTLYHDILRDWEIDHLKERATPYLSRATVHNPKTGKLQYADYRISKSSWIKSEMDSIVAKIYKKVSKITDLDTRSYEPLQIANYGLAGQYEPHYDHASEKKPRRFAMYGGNRLATMLIYLTDVEKGGSTVFTKTGPGVTIKPKKGTGVFWFNLLRNGKSNAKTEHAACPVVIGQKWVSNIWIHEHHQEFSRKCSLNKNE